jgi:hypothetical protein
MCRYHLYVSARKHITPGDRSCNDDHESFLCIAHQQLYSPTRTRNLEPPSLDDDFQEDHPNLQFISPTRTPNNQPARTQPRKHHKVRPDFSRDPASQETTALNEDITQRKEKKIRKE